MATTQKRRGGRRRAASVRKPDVATYSGQTDLFAAPVVDGLPETGGDLERWRREQGMTEAQAAYALAVSRNTLRKYELNPRERLPRNVRLVWAAVNMGVQVPE